MSVKLGFPIQRFTMAVEEADSPMRKAMRRATGSGWNLRPPEAKLTSEILVLHLALDSSFWQSLAKAEGWQEWEPHRQDFIEYLADGGTAGSFFAHLLK
jgi:hypothetical protein